MGWFTSQKSVNRKKIEAYLEGIGALSHSNVEVLRTGDVGETLDFFFQQVSRGCDPDALSSLILETRGHTHASSMMLLAEAHAGRADNDSVNNSMSSPQIESCQSSGKSDKRRQKAKGIDRVCEILKEVMSGIIVQELEGRGFVISSSIVEPLFFESERWKSIDASLDTIVQFSEDEIGVWVHFSFRIESPKVTSPLVARMWNSDHLFLCCGGKVSVTDGVIALNGRYLVSATKRRDSLRLMYADWIVSIRSLLELLNAANIFREEALPSLAHVGGIRGYIDGDGHTDSEYTIFQEIVGGILKAGD